ncbi:hypothetical protein ABVK25_001345 [Lepraria finkii]|uniref:Uncharacterized protein n=1 Tax=Lepraria finkii TaxID=1340010 RepID=A0ABR4BLD1_9LECA
MSRIPTRLPRVTRFQISDTSNHVDGMVVFVWAIEYTRPASLGILVAPYYISLDRQPGKTNSPQASYRWQPIIPLVQHAPALPSQAIQLFPPPIPPSEPS